MSESSSMPVGVSVTLSAGAANAIGAELAQQKGTEHVPYTESVTFGSHTDRVMAEALAAAGKMTPEQAAEAARTGEAPEDAGSTPSAIDANPYRTAQAVESFALSAGIAPDLAKFYGGRIQKALAAPAMSLEAQQQSARETHQAMIDQFGDEADGWMEVARKEVRLLTRDYPDLPAILERTNLGNDMHLIKSLISRAAAREMKARGYKVP